MPDAFTDDHFECPSFAALPWHRPEIAPSRSKALSEHTHDVGNGISALLALIEFHESQQADGAPLFAEIDKAALFRLAIASGKLLAHFAYVQISAANRIQSVAVQVTAAGMPDEEP